MYNINITKLRGENLNNLNIEIVMIRQVNIFFILETRLRHDIFLSNVYLK